MSNSPTQEQIDAFVAVCHGDMDAVRATLARQPELIAMRSSLDESPLGAAAHVGNREIAEYLIAQGAEIDLPSAAMLGDLDAIERFVGADPSAANGAGAHGIPVLFHAVAGGSVPAVELLLEHGADIAAVTGPQSGALNMAAARGHIAMSRWLLDHGAPTDLADFEGKTPIERAQEGGYTEIAEMIQDSRR